jgi:hypothetical protein
MLTVFYWKDGTKQIVLVSAGSTRRILKSIRVAAPAEAEFLA